MTDTHPLDRPVRSALTSGWALLAHGDGALQLDPDYGPFAAPADFSRLGVDDMAKLTPGPDGLWCFEPRATPAPHGMEVIKSAAGLQMVLDRLTPGGAEPEFGTLSDADAPEMLDLALLTRPGPFAQHTNRLGHFIGIRVDGRLAAMAGERMKMPGFTEVSGVCTHPDFRGRGYAPALMRIVIRRILDRGEIAFLHTYADNEVAIALYRSLGFDWRQDMTLSILAATS